MRSGEFLTRTTIWISIVAYTIGCVVSAAAWRQVDLDRWVRIAWTIGCVALVAHFVCAFQFYHSWSHTAAHIDTARPPASTAVQVAALYRPELMLEVEALAIIPW